MSKTFRVSTYEFSFNAFTERSFDLSLDFNLRPNYFAMIIGGSEGNTTRDAADNHVQLTGDPFGTGSLSQTAGPKIIRLERGGNVDAWIGTVAIVECLGDYDKSGFRLVDVVTIDINNWDTTSSSPISSSFNNINQIIPFGGIRGGGVRSFTSGSSITNNGCHGRFEVVNDISPEVVWARDLTGGTSTTAQATVHIVEWGSDWNIQNVLVSGNAGADRANTSNSYDTAPINEVVRQNTFIWGCGHTNDDGIGDSFSGTLITLGDGVNQNATETSVAVGQEYPDDRQVRVYVAENPYLSVEYIFKQDGDGALNIIHTSISPPLGNETYPDAVSSSTYAGALSAPSMDGSDGFWPAFYGSSPMGADGAIDLVSVEDTISDTENAHTQEEIAYLIFGGDENGDIQNSSGQIIGEYGIIDNVDGNGTYLTFANSYMNPIVVVTPFHYPGDIEASVRAYNISSLGCNVRYDSASLSGSISSKKLSYVVLEAGAHTLIGGDFCEAAKISDFSGLNNQLATGWNTDEMIQVNTLNPYSSPVVLGSIQTDNDPRFQAFWANGGSSQWNPSPSSIYIGRHVAEDTVTTRAAEDIGYIIWESGNGLAQIGGRKWYADYSSDSIEGISNNPPFITGVTSTSGALVTRGFRFALQYNGCAGTGGAYPRPYFGIRITDNTNVKSFRGYNGQNFPAWIQCVDFANIEFTAQSARRVAVCS